jgi:hypothetical protein
MFGTVVSTSWAHARRPRWQPASSAYDALRAVGVKVEALWGPRAARSLKILGFFDPAVLAAYREQPDKYTITTDHFEGPVTVTSEYFAQLDDAAQDAGIGR